MPLLRGDDHYILKKLCYEVLPWMIAGRRMRRQWFVIAALVYAYGGELATLLVGLGIGPQVIALFQGKTTGGQDAYALLQQTLPGVWFWVGVAALASWLGLRLVVQQQNATDRALFARDCAQTMQKLELDLADALADPNPLPKIRPIQEALRRVVREAIEKNVWSWMPPTPPAHEIEEELAKRLDEIRSNFMGGWTPPPPGVI